VIGLKDIVWVGSSKKDLLELPDDVMDEFGHGLYEAQQGKHPSSAKPYKINGGAGVLELVERFDTDTYRAVYTVEFEEAIYVLHCFQKKSKEGKRTPKQDDDLIKRRYAVAKESHETWLRERSIPKKS
jgi:phage-related protein